MTEQIARKLDTSALISVLNDIQYVKNLPFIECIAVTTEEASGIADINNDLQREMAFHNQALESVLKARKEILSNSVPFSRPDDYFAEMVKSDTHMTRIRERLIDEQASIKKGEESRRQKDQKKFGKQVQAEVLKGRKMKEKEMNEKVQGLKKKRKIEDTQGASFEDEFDVLISDNEDNGKRRGGKNSHDNKRQRTSNSSSGKGRPGENKKRDAKNSKYGFGGKKKHIKSNDRESSADFTFSAKGNRSGKFDAKKKFSKKPPQQRVGKSRRAQHNKK